MEALIKRVRVSKFLGKFFWEEWAFSWEHTFILGGQMGNFKPRVKHRGKGGSFAGRSVRYVSSSFTPTPFSKRPHIKRGTIHLRTFGGEEKKRGWFGKFGGI